MDRIKRLSMEILDKHKSRFGVDFTDNKKTLNQISVIRSKGLKNEIAGFITKFIKHEIYDQKLKEKRESTSNPISETEENNPSSNFLAETTKQPEATEETTKQPENQED